MAYDPTTKIITRSYRFTTALDAEVGDVISQVQMDLVQDEITADVNTMVADVFQNIGPISPTWITSAIAATAADVLTTGANAVSAAASANAVALASTVYTGADSAITSAGQVVMAHGLGVVPYHINAFLRCTTAEFGYAIGDIVPISDSGAYGDSSGFQMISDATNITVRFGSRTKPFSILGAMTGTSSNLTNGSWSFFLKVAV